jgi:hypothetical protein
VAGSRIVSYARRCLILYPGKCLIFLSFQIISLAGVGTGLGGEGAIRVPGATVRVIRVVGRAV